MCCGITIAIIVSALVVGRVTQGVLKTGKKILTDSGTQNPAQEHFQTFTMQSNTTLQAQLPLLRRL